MALTAIPVGFVAGLFGIGGGLITVPFLYYIFSSLGIDAKYIMHLAVGTSFAIIIPTSAASVITHHKYKAVDFNIVKSYGVFVIIGVVIGTIFASVLKNKVVNIIFFNDNIFVGNLLAFIKRKRRKYISKYQIIFKNYFRVYGRILLSSNGYWRAIMNVPILKFFGYSINKAIGSAAAIGFLIALFGSVGFLISGNYLKANLPFSIGFLNIPAFLIFVPITTFMARIGAKTVHKLDKNIISKILGIFLLIVATKFLFEYFRI